MTWRHTKDVGVARFQVGKLIAGISGMAVFALGASIALWRASVCIPDLKFSSVLFGVPCIGLYVAMIVNLVRLRRKLKSLLSIAPNETGSSDGNA